MDSRMCLCFLACSVFVNATSDPRGIQQTERVEADMEIYADYVHSGCPPDGRRNVTKKLEETLMKVHFQNERHITAHSDIQTLIYRLNSAEFKGLTINSSDLLNDASSTYRHSMHFPKTLMDKAQRTPAKEMRLICIYLKASCLFQDRQNSSLLNGVILGASLGNMNVANLAEPVEIRFWHKHSLVNFSMTCVFWVEGTGEDNLGEWSPKGCETNTSQEEDVILCKCDHLTYFAVLLQLSSESPDEELLAPLEYLSDIGCGVSALACLITIFLYLFTRKLYHDSTTKIHINLLGALFFLNMSFLISETLDKRSWGCRVLAAFLHYSLLGSLTWMAIEGFHLYMLVIKVYNTYINRYLLKLCAAGWGLPGVIILISFLSRQTVYGEHILTTGSSYKNVSICWITSPILHHITFAYAGGTVFFNMVVLAMVVHKLRQLRARPLHQPKEHTCKDVGTVLGMTFLLGITWALAFVTFGVFSVPQIFLFTIFNSLQGAIICLWYCFLRCRSASKRSSGFSQSSAMSPGL
ncbi:adhesion G-protein coupled receptor G5 [Vipera latastei]